jgi:hypothetical protein
MIVRFDPKGRAFPPLESWQSAGHKKPAMCVRPWHSLTFAHGIVDAENVTSANGVGPALASAVTPCQFEPLAARSGWNCELL